MNAAHLCVYVLLCPWSCWVGVCCEYILAPMLLCLTTTRESINFAWQSQQQAQTSNPAQPCLRSVTACAHPRALLVVRRATLDQTPDCGDYYCWPHTYSCTHAGYKIFNSRLPSSLFLSCLLSTWNQFGKTRDPCLLAGQKHHQRVFPCSLLGLLVLSNWEGDYTTWVLRHWH